MLKSIMKGNNFRRIIILSFSLAFFSLLLFECRVFQKDPGKLSFEISFSDKLSDAPLDGRLFLLISNDSTREPRFQISYINLNSQLIFGKDINNVKSGDIEIFDKSVFGYPLKSISEIPPGKYFAQALLHKYETFNRSDGFTLKLPMDRGEGQQWNRAPGNLYSTPKEIYIDPTKNETLKIVLDQEIPPIPEPETTKYIKHVKIQSELLTEFWGRPMFLGAHILLPEGFEKHPDARYPLIINHGHFPYTFSGFSENPEGQGRSDKFFKAWTGPNFPRVIIIKIQHANPYYDDSYAVNSANLGPYGDAITYELIPYIEERFRCLGESWARTLIGGSTGGWESLAVQIFYPDDYNGAWGFCPDPVDFRAYTVVNIYEDKNAYYYEGIWKRVPRPGARNHLGKVLCTNEEMNHYEYVLGSKGRSGQQLDIFQAVYGPVGQDGYPKPIWDKFTGVINNSVANYWKENYDLRYILERDWETLGPKLKGKINIYVGDMDTYYLNNAVYLMEDFLKTTKHPYYNGIIQYGDRDVHCWTGPNPEGQSYLNQYVPLMVTHMRQTAPPGADKTSWKY